MNDTLRISLMQTDIVWENKDANIRRLRQQIENLSGETDIVVLPETFSTGFNTNVQALAEPVHGKTITTLKHWCRMYQLAFAGSYIACDNAPHPHYTNRAFFLTPEGDEYYYDKRHLFRMGHENQYFTAGDSRPIIHYMGWNILLLICYDLRFPVWSRNVNNEYDLLIYVANWPMSRRNVWDNLLQARAIENESYVCGVNRIGTDGKGLLHNGGSRLLSYKGELLTAIPDNQAGVVTTTIHLSELQTFRTKFPVWMDADSFELKNPINYTS